jgi:hypothetical protein
MGAFSIWHWLVLLAALSTIVPIAKVLSRAGLNPWWAALTFVPVVGWLGLWAFAYTRWPKVPGIQPAAPEPPGEPASVGQPRLAATKRPSAAGGHLGHFPDTDAPANPRLRNQAAQTKGFAVPGP